MPLQHVKIAGDKDPKDGKPLIKIDSPSSQLLILKADSQADYVMWYNSIYVAAVHAHAKRKLDEFDKALNRLELENSRNDKKEIASFFSGIEGMLKESESCKLLFENLEQHKPEYKYLAETYSSIQEYKELCKRGQLIGAFMIAKKIHTMINNFSITSNNQDEETKESDKEGGPQKEEDQEIPDREDLSAEMQKAYIEQDFKELVNGITKEPFKVALSTLIQVGNLEKSMPSALDIFNEFEAGLVSKFKVLHDEIKAMNKPDKDAMKLLIIPLTRFKKAIKWIPATYYEDYVERQRMTEEIESRSKSFRIPIPAQNMIGTDRHLQRRATVNPAAVPLPIERLKKKVKDDWIAM